MNEVLEERIRLWLEDEDSSVEYAEAVGDRWAVRVRQDARDATTVWFWPRQVSMQYEAYVMPTTPESLDVFRQSLIRNRRSWRVFYAIDEEGGLVLRGRLASSEVSLETLDLVLGEIVEAIEVGFRPMVRALMNVREISG